MLVIQDDATLNQVCKKIQDGSIIAIDTEFVRVKTYNPVLSLIQFNFVTPKSQQEDIIHKDTYIIDVLSKVNLKPFLKVFNNRHNIKVFHSFYQDLEVLYNLTNQIPKNIYDTQIMASFCNYERMISYAELVKEICNVELNKEERLSNWLERPLTQEQLEYSSRDVEYLADIFLILQQKIQNLNRETWERTYTVELLKSYKIQFKDLEVRAWNKFNFHAKSPTYTKVLMGVSSWRERTAKQRNVNRAQILTDKTLKEIALQVPRNLQELKRISELAHFSTEDLHTILGVVNCALKISDSKVIRRMKSTELGTNGEINHIIMEIILRMKGVEYGLPYNNLVSKEVLRQIAKEPKKLKHCLTKWQYDIYGKYVEEVLNGKIVLGYKNGEVLLLDNSEE